MLIIIDFCKCSVIIGIGKFYPDICFSRLSHHYFYEVNKLWLVCYHSQKKNIDVLQTETNAPDVISSTFEYIAV